MCGIVGLINPGRVFNWKIKDAFCEMLYADAVRGRDSTGVLFVKENTTDWRKAAVAPMEFFGMEGVMSFLRKADEQHFIVGHNRAASKGKVNNENAHPFDIDHIVGVHNGTIWSTHSLKPEKDMEVDSEMVFNAIAKEGIKAVSSKLQGSYSLVWYNRDTKNLNFLRNSERPMFLAWTQAPELVFFGSELALLEWVAKRNKFSIVRSMETTPHHVYKFKEGAAKPTVMKVDEYKSPVYSGGYQNWRHVRADNDEVDDFYNVGIPKRQPVLMLPDLKQEVGSPVYPFPQGKKKTPTGVNAAYRTWLATLLTQWKVGNILEFSVFDFGDKCEKGQFYPITGQHTRWPEEVVVKGNFNGTEESLMKTKNLMRGTIKQVALMKHEDKVLIQVSDVAHTGVPDPLLEKKTQEEKFKETHAKSTYRGRFACAECGGTFGPGVEATSVVEDGITTFVCPGCMDQPKKEKSIMCTKEGECKCGVDIEYCVYYQDGTCPDRNMTLQ